MNHPHLPNSTKAFGPAAVPVGRSRRLVPNELTGASFPALYLVRSSWLVRWLARATFVSLLVGFIALFFVPWQQTSRGQGRVVARDPQQRPQTVTATYDGIIEWIRPGLQEGAHVVAGEMVIRMAPFAPEEISQVKNQLAQAELKKLATEKARDFAIQNVSLQRSSGEAELRSEQLAIESARAKWEQEKAALNEAKALYTPKKNKYDSLKDLVPRLVSEQSLFEAFADEQAARQKIDQAEGKVDEAFQNLSSKEEAYESKKQSVEVKNNEAENKLQAEIGKLAEVEKEIQEINVKLGQLGRLEVTSPRTGVIQSLEINSGSDTVKKGDQLFIVVPETAELAVELTIPGNDSPLVHVGDDVRLQFQGWPAIQWVGWPSIAIGTFGGRVNSINPSDDGKGDFKVFVTPDLEDPGQEKWPDNRYLRQGVRANGWVLLKTVPLGYELWRQLNGFPPIIDPPASKDASDKKADDPKKPKLPKS
jgi:multidrug resistance efflux pump